jgi:hypothetical protein
VDTKTTKEKILPEKERFFLIQHENKIAFCV